MSYYQQGIHHFVWQSRFFVLRSLKEPGYKAYFCPATSSGSWTGNSGCEYNRLDMPHLPISSPLWLKNVYIRSKELWNGGFIPCHIKYIFVFLILGLYLAFYSTLGLWQVPCYVWQQMQACTIILPTTSSCQIRLCWMRKHGYRKVNLEDL